MRELVRSIVDETAPILIDHEEAAMALDLTLAALDYRINASTLALDDAVVVGKRQLYRSEQIRDLILAP